MLVPSLRINTKINEEKETTSPDVEPKDTGEPGKSDDDGLFIGLSLPTQSVERWVKDGVNIAAECDARGIKLATQMANDDANKQISQCENLISQGVDILIVAPHDANSSGNNCRDGT